MRGNFIAAWVTQQQRAFNQSTRGILTPENRQVLEDEAEAGMAAIERAAAAKALTEAADELALLNDGGKRGLAGHSKSSASAITHRHSVAVIRARAEAYRREETE